MSQACPPGSTFNAAFALIQVLLCRTRIVLPHKLVLACEAAIRAQQCARSSNPQASHACPAGRRIDFRQAYELAMRVSANTSITTPNPNILCFPSPQFDAQQRQFQGAGAEGCKELTNPRRQIFWKYPTSTSTPSSSLPYSAVT